MLRYLSGSSMDSPAKSSDCLDDSDYSMLTNVVHHMFLRTEEKIATQGKLSDAVMLELHMALGEAVDNAMLLLDGKDCVVFLESPSKRRMVQISGSCKAIYTLFCNTNYCRCPTFRSLVMNGEWEALTCKHVVAAWLGPLIGKSRVLKIPEATMSHVPSLQEMSRIVVCACLARRASQTGDSLPGLIKSVTPLAPGSRDILLNVSSLLQ